MSRLIWTDSEIFVPTVDQPHESKSVHVNGQEVTTVDISDVHSGLSRKLNNWFPSVCFSSSVGLMHAVFAKIVQCKQKQMLRAVPPGMRVQYIVCC